MCPTMTVSLLRLSSNYDRCSQGKQHLKTCVFRRLRKTDSDMLWQNDMLVFDLCSSALMTVKHI